jgi:cyclohexadieny/prephenate dehydrogenase
MATDAPFERVALIGLGLIGASLSHVMRREGLAHHISGHARTEATRSRAMELGLCHSMHETAAAAAAGADLVVLCVPVSACAALAQEIGPVLAPGAIVTDVGSVKQAVVRDVAPHIPDGVDSHPRPSDRRHRVFRPRRRLRRTVPQPLVHPDAAGDREPQCGRTG